MQFGEVVIDEALLWVLFSLLVVFVILMVALWIGRKPESPERIITMTVSDLIKASFRQASERHFALHEAWIRISYRIGGLLPKSALLLSVQRYGELDLVLRCMEEELAPKLRNNPGLDSHYQYQLLFSEIWVGGIYEILRLLNERKLALDNDEYRALFRDFELLRITIEKHDNANQGKLTAPLQMTTYDQTKVYTFTKDDPQRSHIMPMVITAKGSVVWQAIDVRANTDRWIERRSLSDRMIALWEVQPAQPA